MLYKHIRANHISKEDENTKIWVKNLQETTNISPVDDQAIFNTQYKCDHADLESIFTEDKQANEQKCITDNVITCVMDYMAKKYDNLHCFSVHETLSLMKSKMVKLPPTTSKKQIGPKRVLLAWPNMPGEQRHWVLMIHNRLTGMTGIFDPKFGPTALNVKSAEIVFFNACEVYNIESVRTASSREPQLALMQTERDFEFKLVFAGHTSQQVAF